MWAALRAAGHAVDVVVVGRDPVRLQATDRMLETWTRTPRPAQTTPTSAGELASVRQAVADLDLPALETWGGLNGAIARCAALEEDVARSAAPGPAISAGRTWRSRRVPE